MNMNWQDMEKLLEKALENVLMEVSEDGKNIIADELNNAWNRGAKQMLNETLILFIRNEREMSA